MIGVIGAHGAVGTEVVRLLAPQGVGALRLGARDPQALRRALAPMASDAEVLAVDVTQPASLQAFIRGCRLVINCAGPSSRFASRVATAGLESGVHVVDAGSDEQLEAMSDQDARTSVVFSAGALPGVSGLLPRWLAASFDSTSSLVLYSGVLDRFTAAGAEDYLASVMGRGTESLAAWQGGEVKERALSRQAHARVPFFPREVTLLPYVDAECRYVARQLDLAEARWYIALDGEHLHAALDGARSAEPADAVRALCRASSLDLAGRKPYARLLAQMAGSVQGEAAMRTALLQAPGIATLTGATTSAVALALLQGALPAGIYAASAIPNPKTIVDRLQALSTGCELRVVDVGVDELAEVSGGVI